MNTEKQINLSDKFQVYQGRKLAGSFDTAEQARRFLTQLTLAAYIVYPAKAVKEQA